jgi:hypothetical protein
MSVAQGINKQTVFKKQTALGSPASGGSGQIIRRTSSVFQAPRDTYETNEIVSHQQSTGVGYGLKKPAGKIDGVLSAGTYAAFFQSLLRADFAATSAYNAGTDVTAAAAGPQFVDASGGFLTAGLKVGDVVRWTGFAGDGASNNSKNFLITALTATDMTGVMLNGDAVVADAAADDTTVTVVGKKSKVPLTSHTNDYYTFEEWYSDLTRSETFTDAKIAMADIGLPSTGNSTVSFDILALNRVLGASQVLTSPTAETTTEVLTALSGVVYANGTVVSNCTGASLSITGNMQHGDATIGTNSALDVDRGRVSVSGQFTAMFDSVTLQALYDAETTLSLVLVLADSEEDDADFVTFTMGKIKLTGDAPDDGEKQIVRTYPFTAEICGEGGAALAWDQTIITIQDSDAA